MPQAQEGIEKTWKEKDRKRSVRQFINTKALNRQQYPITPPKF